jgi:hypothetical protein
MDVNENIALVVIGLNDPLLQSISQIELNTKSLLQLWNKHSYTIFTINSDDADGLGSIQLLPNTTEALTARDEKIIEGLFNALQTNPFSRLVLVGIAQEQTLSLLARFSQTSGVLLYQVSDALSFEKCEKVAWDAITKKVTTQQIMTLSKGIRDKG